jgi:hypothetical protein
VGGRIGLTAEISKALARRSFVPVDDRGRELVQVAAIADVDVMRHQSWVLGRVASAPTVLRALGEVTRARLRKGHDGTGLASAAGLAESEVSGHR